MTAKNAGPQFKPYRIECWKQGAWTRLPECYDTRKAASRFIDATGMLKARVVRVKRSLIAQGGSNV